MNDSYLALLLAILAFSLSLIALTVVFAMYVDLSARLGEIRASAALVMALGAKNPRPGSQ